MVQAGDCVLGELSEVMKGTAAPRVGHSGANTGGGGGSTPAAVENRKVRGKRIASPVEVRRSKRAAVCDRRRLYGCDVDDDGIGEEEEEELGLEEVMLGLETRDGVKVVEGEGLMGLVVQEVHSR